MSYIANTVYKDDKGRLFRLGHAYYRDEACAELLGFDVVSAGGRVEFFSKRELDSMVERKILQEDKR